MDCQFINENIIDYLEKELNPEDQMKLASHLESCPSCQHLVNEVRLTYQLAARPPAFQISEDFVDQTILRLHKKEARIIPLVYQALKPIAVAASIGLGIMIGNGELSVLNSTGSNTLEDALVLSVSTPASYSVWQTLEEDYGSKD